MKNKASRDRKGNSSKAASPLKVRIPASSALPRPHSSDSEIHADSLRPTLEIEVDAKFGRMYGTIDLESLAESAIALNEMKQTTLPAIARLSAVPA